MLKTLDRAPTYAQKGLQILQKHTIELSQEKEHQKTPIEFIQIRSKEPYRYAKRALQKHQKSPVDRPKAPYQAL